MDILHHAQHRSGQCLVRLIEGVQLQQLLLRLRPERLARLDVLVRRHAVVLAPGDDVPRLLRESDHGPAHVRRGHVLLAVRAKALFA